MAVAAMQGADAALTRLWSSSGGELNLCEWMSRLVAFTV